MPHEDPDNVNEEKGVGGDGLESGQVFQLSIQKQEGSAFLVHCDSS